MVVTLRTSHGHAHKYRRDGVDFVGDIDDTILFWQSATLVGVHAVSQKARCQLILWRCIGKQIASELLDNELVVRQVAVIGIDHPFPPQPHIPMVVDRKSVGVRVPSGIQPRNRHSLPKVR